MLSTVQAGSATGICRLLLLPMGSKSSLRACSCMGRQAQLPLFKSSAAECHCLQDQC